MPVDVAPERRDAVEVAPARACRRASTPRRPRSTSGSSPSQSRHLRERVPEVAVVPARPASRCRSSTSRRSRARPPRTRRAPRSMLRVGVRRHRRHAQARGARRNRRRPDRRARARRARAARRRSASRARCRRACTGTMCVSPSDREARARASPRRSRAALRRAPRAALRLGGDQRERGARRGDRRRREAGRVDEAARAVRQQVDERARAGDVCAGAAERLAERAHLHVDRGAEPVGSSASPAPRAPSTPVAWASSTITLV